ncbi:hypothetical protein FOL46_009045 [Perkinsus olseni]|uniref:Peptidyl-prolyl cis-trans isomerase n=1 Tax=Perkinsus olseni TaxID=32597 RepID=A0A7J6L2M8_PEROL|nr:hypothetical protein FOL46_009045 [Perkinsus olseni]
MPLKLREWLQNDFGIPVAASSTVTVFALANVSSNTAKQSSSVRYFDVAVGDVGVGRMIFRLFDDVLPVTCENFRALCTGETGLGYWLRPRWYQNTRMYRIIPGFMCQGGDFNFGNGGMGESIYGQFMRNERFAFSHSKRGVLSMADAGWEHSNNSNFFITFGPQKHLDSKHVAFGAIEHGMEVLDAIEKVGTIGGKPKRPVIIHKSGELNVDLLRREAIEANEGLPLGSEEYVERSADSWGNPDPEIDDDDVYCMPERLTMPDQYSPVPDHLFRRAKAQWDNQL